MKKTIAFIVSLLLCTSALITCVAINNTVSTNTADYTMTFSDVSETDWFYEDVLYVSKRSLMNGTSDTEFSPNGMTTRGMIVTILWRLEKEPEGKENCFEDVTSEDYYYQAVSWASKNNIVSGYDGVSFGPNDSITREQLATILYRYVSYKKYNATSDADISKFEDFEGISNYAIEAIKWAYKNEIITGITSDTISPKGNATRCQVATILKRVCENILITNTEKPVETEQSKAEESSAPTKAPSSASEVDVPSFGGGPSEDDEDKEAPNEIIEKFPTIQVATVYGKPGDIVEVKLEIQENPGILGMVLSLEYDESAMKLLEAKNGKAVADVLALTSSRTLSSGARFVWDGIELNPSNIKNGTILTLEFKIKDDAIIGKRYPLRITCDSGDVVDMNLNEVNLSIRQGFIEIEEDE